ncbi:MAG: 3-phosphoshikimate 1-carboxyvinyltransferase [bacterium]
MLRVQGAGPLTGEIRVPGDKSISHRAVILSSLCPTETRIEAPLLSEDVTATIKAFQAMGADLCWQGPDLMVSGKEPRELEEPSAPLDMGNSGTGMRLLAGLLSGLPLETELRGDESLMKRPMKRIIDPLRMMGADIRGTQEYTAPLYIKGGGLRGISYSLPVASAQVKSALLLAGMTASGETVLEEPAASRDHTELMLPAFSVNVKKEGLKVSIGGGQKPVSPGSIRVPGDISSAAFFAVAALVVPGSDLVIKEVGLNPTRTGAIDVLRSMGGRIELLNKKRMGGEPVADLHVKASRLSATVVSGGLVARAIDELPVICVAAAMAYGTTVIRDAAELRVKESDRIENTARLLAAMGADVKENPDGLVIKGPASLRGADIESDNDHRIAMAAAIAGLCAKGQTAITGTECIATSFPDFESRLTELSR